MYDKYMNQITAVIPIRGGSTRCKHKSIRPFGDTTLLELRIKILQQVKEIDIIQVNSDSDEVLRIAKSLGVQTFKRDSIYASDDADGTMVYQCLSDACPTDIMLIAFTPTPFITAEDYSKCISIFREGKHDSVLSMHHMKDYIFHDKKPVNFNPLKTCKSQDLPNYYNMTFGITVINTKYVQEHHSIWRDNPYFYEVDQLKAMDIDTNMDFVICEHLYRNFKNLDDLNMTINSAINIDVRPEAENTIPHDVYLGAVYDALNLMVDNPMDHVLQIKPVAGYTDIIYGPALTLYGRKITKHENYQEIDNHRFNFYKPEYYQTSPIVLLQSNDDVVSHTGDITSKIFQKLGAKGYITDGIARDIELIDKINFPVFCNGVNPIDAISNNWAYTDINVPITIENRIIYPGDFVFASKDGVIIIPVDMFSTFTTHLHEIMKKEREIRTFVDKIGIDNMDNDIRTFIRDNGRF